MKDKQRQVFEEWYKENHTKNVQRIDGQYVHGVTERLWQAWQAGIASVVVELPPRLRGIDEQCRINNKAVDMMQQKLTEAGIRYE